MLRKYHDAATINIYINLVLENNDKLKELMEKIGEEDTRKDIKIFKGMFAVKKIKDWLHGKDKLPINWYAPMSEYVKKSQQLKSVTALIYKDDSYKDTRQRCNDHAHSNFFDNLMINNSSVYLESRADTLNMFHKDLVNIFILHLTYIFILNDHYMTSTEYMDCLEMGMTPEKSLQYEVDPCVQNIFTTVIAKERPDLAQLIIEHSSMHLKPI